MAANLMQSAMNIWAFSDRARKQELRRKVLETHGEFTAQNDFIGFLVAEFDH